MNTIKHRKFSEHHFIERFAQHESILKDFLNIWGLPELGLTEEVDVASFIGYLTNPPAGNEAYERRYDTKT